MCVQVHVCLRACTWRPQDEAGMFLNLSPSYIEGFSVETRVPHQGWSSWLACHRNAKCPAAMPTHTLLSFLDLNSVFHTSAAAIQHP